MAPDLDHYDLDAEPYLAQHKPVRSQFRAERRAAVTGAIVLHTVEIDPGQFGDPVALRVAKFIRNRKDAGSYHTVVDTVLYGVRLVAYESEAYGEGTGGNKWALHLSFACRAADWATYGDPLVHQLIDQGVRAAVHMAKWLETEHGIIVPARRITAEQYRNGEPGFISHAELDPGRRSDPGADFPWDRFLRYFGQTVGRPAAGDDVVDAKVWLPFESAVADLQRMLVGAGYDLGDYGPDGDGVDGVFGGLTATALTGWWDATSISVKRLIDLMAKAIDMAPDETR